MAYSLSNKCAKNFWAFGNFIAKNDTEKLHRIFQTYVQNLQITCAEVSVLAKKYNISSVKQDFDGEWEHLWTGALPDITYRLYTGDNRNQSQVWHVLDDHFNHSTTAANYMNKITKG